MFQHNNQIQNHQQLASIRPRTGFSLIELIAACAMLGVVMSMAIPMMFSTANVRRATEQRQFALQYASNLIERETSKEWADLAVGIRNVDDFPGDLKSMLPGGEASVDVEELQVKPLSKRVAVSVRWKDRSGNFVSPLRLTSWVYSNDGDQP